MDILDHTCKINGTLGDHEQTIITDHVRRNTQEEHY